MNTLLDTLEQKTGQVAALCAALRAENHRLRERIDSLENEKRVLAERMTTARSRLEILMDKLPAE